MEDWGVEGSDRMQHESSSAAERDLEKTSIQDITLGRKYAYERTGANPPHQGRLVDKHSGKKLRNRGIAPSCLTCCTKKLFDVTPWCSPCTGGNLILVFQHLFNTVLSDHI